jgi:hypothetical protein
MATNQEKLDGIYSNIVDAGQQTFEQQIADHVLKTPVQRQTAAGPLKNPDGTPSMTSLGATLAWLDGHISDLLAKPTADPAAIAKAVTDAVAAQLPALVTAAIAAHPPTVDVNSIAEAVEARIKAQYDK